MNKVFTIKNKCPDFLIKLIWIFFTIIITYLLLGSIFSTSFIGNLEFYIPESGKLEITKEHTFYVRDIWWIHLTVFIFFSVVLSRIHLKNSRVVEIGCCMITTVLSIFIAIMANRYPWSDQRQVMEIATAFNSGDYSALERGGYLFIYPFQYGIVLFYQACSLLFGNNNWLAFQILNAFFIGSTYYVLILILKKINYRFSNYTLTLCVSFFFTPYLFYTILIYGNVIGLLLALTSFYFLLKFDENNKIIYAIISGGTIVVSTILKTNCLIFMIAEIIFILFSIFQNFENRRRMIKRILCILLMVLGFWLSKNAVSHQLIKLAGEPVKGCPTITWVAMGMQDSKMAPGWWNGYNDGTYKINDYDYEATEKAATESIRKTISTFSDSVSTMLGFYSKKIMCMWNNPLFQSLWLVDVTKEGNSGLDFLLSGSGRYIYTWVTNILHTWILIGVFLYCILGYRERKYQMILLPITFIGGFVFHIFWEEKCIFAMPYFLLLIPLCVLGYQYWREYLLMDKEKLLPMLGKIGVVLLLICLFSYTKVFVKLIARNDDTYVFNTYTQKTVRQNMEMSDN